MKIFYFLCQCFWYLVPRFDKGLTTLCIVFLTHAFNLQPQFSEQCICFLVFGGESWWEKSFITSPWWSVFFQNVSYNASHVVPGRTFSEQNVKICNMKTVSHLLKFQWWRHEKYFTCHRNHMRDTLWQWWVWICKHVNKCFWPWIPYSGT